MSVVLPPQPFQVWKLPADAIQTLGETLEKLPGFKLNLSWEDKKGSLHIPFGHWADEVDRVPVLERDANGKYKSLRLMTQYEATSAAVYAAEPEWCGFWNDYGAALSPLEN